MMQKSIGTETPAKPVRMLSAGAPTSMTRIFWAPRAQASLPLQQNLPGTII
jgi:hypothetical protein